MAASKAKPRDFYANPKLLQELNAHNYDKMDDMSQLQVQVEAALEKLRVQWKAYDETKLTYLIRKQTITELIKIEERKQVRRDQAEIVKRRKEKLEEDREMAEISAVGTTMMSKSGMFGSPGKSGVNFMDKS